MKHSIINGPNLLTLSRIVMTPFIVFFIIVEQFMAGLLMLIVAGLTDMLDGLWAKRMNCQTTIGAYLDPIADKLMLIGCIVALFIIDVVPLYLFLAVIFRDVIIIVGAIAYELVTKRLEMQPTMVSKTTTVFQIIYVAVALLAMVQPLPGEVLNLAAWATFAITFFSGVQYMWLWTVKAMQNGSD